MSGTAKPSPSAPTATAPKVAFDALRILVLDGDLNRGKFICQILDNLRIGRSFATANATTALQRIQEEGISAAMIDLGSADGTFIEILRDPRRTPAAGLPVLGMTGRVTRPQLTHAVHAGVDFIIQRPFSANDLATRIASMLAKPAPQFSSAEYVGPDRRRMPDDLYDGEMRRSDDA